MLADLIPAISGMFRIIRRLKLGWLGRHGIGIVRGLEPITEDEIAAVTRKRPGRKRLVIDEDQIRDQLRVPEYLEDVWEFPDGAFSLVAGGRRIGIGIKSTDPLGFARLYWFKLRDVTRLFHALEGPLIEAASKYAIPRERYAQCGALEP